MEGGRDKRDLSFCRCGLVECGRKLLNVLPEIGEGEEEGTDEYWVSTTHTDTHARTHTHTHTHTLYTNTTN